MGGRGSSFKTNANTQIKLSENGSCTPLIDAEQDTISERNNDYIDILQDENINVCISTDTFRAENMSPNIKKLYDMTEKFSGISKQIKHTQLDIRGAQFKGNTVACFSYNPWNKEGMTIFMNSNLKTTTKEEIEKRTKTQIENKFWAPCDKEEYINQDLAHEFGHFVQKLIIDKKQDKELTKNMTAQQIDKYESMLALKCKQDILKIQKERFNKTDNFISKYGKKSSFEFFAEIFSNLVTSKSPTTLAKSLEIYIKENL